MPISSPTTDASEDQTCASCGTVVPQPRPLLCVCGVSLAPSSQSALGLERAAALRTSRHPSSAWLFFWCASTPFQVLASLAALLPSARDYLTNIHDVPFLLLLASSPAAFTQPVFLAAWLFQGKAHAFSSPARRLAFALALFCTVTVFAMPLILRR